MSHTPGPWRTTADDRYGAVIAECPFEDREQCRVCRTTEYSDGIRSSNYDGYGGHLICESVGDRDNASLITAGPELLAVLGGVEEFLNGCDKATLAAAEEFGVLRAIRSVIAGAKGQGSS